MRFYSSCLGLRSLQRLHPEPVQPDDGVQPGRHLRPHADALAGGDGGGHDEHQVPKHRGGNTHRELREGRPLFASGLRFSIRAAFIPTHRVAVSIWEVIRQSALFLAAKVLMGRYPSGLNWWQHTAGSN